MARTTKTADDQIKSLVNYYLDPSRNYIEAVAKLQGAVAQALSTLDTGLTAGATYPRPYPGVAKYNMRWIKVHSYWFSYVVVGGESVIVNVLHDRANIPGRVAPYRESRRSSWMAQENVSAV